MSAMSYSNCALTPVLRLDEFWMNPLTVRRTGQGDAPVVNALSRTLCWLLGESGSTLSHQAWVIPRGCPHLWPRLLGDRMSEWLKSSTAFPGGLQSIRLFSKCRGYRPAQRIRSGATVHSRNLPILAKTLGACETPGGSCLNNLGKDFGK